MEGIYVEIKMIISIGIAVVNFIVCVVSFIRNVVKAIKQRDWALLKEELTKEIIPLMEEAERKLKDPTEKEEWVIKKLSDKTHIDFFKYANILSLAKNIIKEICKTTKIDVNKVVFVNEIEKPENETEVRTNGVA